MVPITSHQTVSYYTLTLINYYNQSINDVTKNTLI